MFRGSCASRCFVGRVAARQRSTVGMTILTALKPPRRSAASAFGHRLVIDLANSPSFEDKAVLEFFETAGRNLLAAEAAAGVGHHIALSIVAIDRTNNGYFRAKTCPGKPDRGLRHPLTIIRSTQFMEFLRGIADSSAAGNIVRLPPILFQPVAADDVAVVVADVALAAPRYPDPIFVGFAKGGLVPVLRRVSSDNVRGTESLQIRRWREPDSNHRSRSRERLFRALPIGDGGTKGGAA